jgi:uridine monophosphate synthetase
MRIKFFFFLLSIMLTYLSPLSTLDSHNENFFERLDRRAEKVSSLLCVGIDPHRKFIRDSSSIALRAYCNKIVNETSSHALCFKINIAFFEAFGPEGMIVLKDLVESIDPEIPVILDTKGGDVSSTALAYKEAYFDYYKVDAVTLNPFLGTDSINPFLSNPFKGVFLLTKTSDSSSNQIQNLLIEDENQKKIPLYQLLARRFQEHPLSSQIGLKVGSLDIQALSQIREEVPKMWILSLGVLTEGGGIYETLKASLRKDGKGILISISQDIGEDKNPGKKARYFKELINGYIGELQQGRYFTSKDPIFPKVARGLIEHNCVEFGSFILKSGESSPIYIDLRKLISYPNFMNDVAFLYLKMMKGLNFDRIAGLPYAGLPITTAIALKGNLPMVFTRKERKIHGTKKLVEGVYKAGERLVLVDDVITSGESKKETLEQLSSKRLIVKDVVVLIDREQGGPETLKEIGLELHSAFKLSELLDFWAQEKLITKEQQEGTKKYLSKKASG